MIYTVLENLRTRQKSENLIKVWKIILLKCGAYEVVDPISNFLNLLTDSVCLNKCKILLSMAVALILRTLKIISY